VIKDHFEILKQVISDCEDLNPRVKTADLKPEHLFQENLGLDSLALMTLAYELQEHYPDLDETSIIEWNKIQDCLDTLKKLK
jgi:acyl carrier protein